MYKNNTKRAFTLVELLVVIGIIGILAAMLFPVFAQAREKARAAVCLSNCKQIGASIMLYADDYDESIVPWLTARETPDQPHSQRIWVAKLQPYIKNGGGTQASGVFNCPSYTDANLFKASDAPDCDGPGSLEQAFPPQEVYAHYGIVYQMNGVAGSGTQQDPYYEYAGSYGYPADQGGLTRSLASVMRPAETALVGDGITLYGGGYVVVTAGCEAGQMHQGGGNFVFLDGHAKRLTGNAERILDQQTDGSYYKRYFTVSME
jgi:prepilin-type N-terminal cleavage/methylation domain-containing protein/prepilin-type processing-associated H-X9-DG protein